MLRGASSHACLPQRSVLELPSQAARRGTDLPSTSLLSLLRTLAIGCGPTLITQNDLISRALTLFHLQRPFVLIRAHSQGPGCGPIFWRLLFTPPHPWCVALSSTQLLRPTACGVPGWPQPGRRAGTSVRLCRALRWAVTLPLSSTQPDGSSAPRGAWCVCSWARPQFAV